VIRRKEVIVYTEEGKAKRKEVNGRNASKARGMEWWDLPGRVACGVMRRHSRPNHKKL
jgi:hypothetical protein